jgi:hypothetical protein
MIIVRLRGGLGNQLFQYAAGRALALRVGTELKLDLAEFEQPGPRVYELHRFNVCESFLEPGEKRRIGRWLRRRRHKWGRALDAVWPWRVMRYVHDRETGFDPQVLRVRGDAYLAGFWQREEYFADIAEVIRREFAFRAGPDERNATTLAEIAAGGNAVCVHVRRGDYLDPQMHSLFGLCGPEYYRRAMDLMRARVAGPRFFLFSDDPAWTRGNFDIDARTRLVDHNVGSRDHEDLRLMAACRHFIIANSSFSWWGAWLSPFGEKIVVAPRIWLADAERSGFDPCPAGWIRF